MCITLNAMRDLLMQGTICSTGAVDKRASRHDALLGMILAPHVP
jgi:hypothetical protein